MTFNANPKLEFARKLLGKNYTKLLTIHNYCKMQEVFSDVSKDVLFVDKLLKDGNRARSIIFKHIAESELKGEPIDYLEFGVHKGESFREWMGLSSNPQSRFFGFDTFEGLPEDWGPTPKGCFDVKGKLPEIPDGRGQFYAGLFQKTLPSFLATYEPKNRMVVHLDADLYTSTLFTLTSLDRFFKPGTLIMFDEFSDCLHEFSAFYDYCRSFYRDWELLASRVDLWKTVFRLK